jgi:hypothetical protein
MQRRFRSWRQPASALAVTATALAATVAFAIPSGATQTFLGRFSTISEVASTVPVATTPPRPGDGDLNPYGVAVVPHTTGRLVRGDVLVSNFNNAANQQGRGRTIVEISPSGSVSIFARIPALPGGVGLTTALAVLPDGVVVVGNLPTTDGMSATARRGGLLILDRNGTLIDNLTGADINGPWDLTATDFGDIAVLYVTNVLNGTVAAGGSVVNRGTVVRLVLDVRSGFPRVVSDTIIGSGFAERTDPAALVVGPTGVGLGTDGTLYVADTVNSAIRAIPNADFRTTSAGQGRLVTASGALNGPLGLTIVPNGDIVTVNAGDGRAVETSPQGSQVAIKYLDMTGTPPGSGALFGLAIAPKGGGLYFVDDDTNQLNLLGG